MPAQSFAFLSVTQDELRDLHRLLVMRYVMENNLRTEQGLEALDPPRILETCAQLLGISPEESHRLLHATEDTLWEYSWYTFTNEWAWHRAKQDTLKTIGLRHGLDEEALDAKIEEQYDRAFDRYVAEVDMRESLPKFKNN